jgi:hypothetical protein
MRTYHYDRIMAKPVIGEMKEYFTKYILLHKVDSRKDVYLLESELFQQKADPVTQYDLQELWETLQL